MGETRHLPNRHRAVNFYLELINEGGGFPKGVNYTWANDYRRQAYEEDSDLPHIWEAYIRMPGYGPDETDLLKRVRAIDDDSILLAPPALI